MRKKFNRKYLKIGSFLAALNLSCSTSNAMQAAPTVIYKSSGNSGAKTFLGASLPVTVLLIAAGGFALNEYYGSQGHPWAHPLWSNKGIKAINKNGISKNEIKDADENSGILTFFEKSAETLESNVDVLEIYKGKSIKEIFSKFKPQFTIKASDEKKENNNLCVIVRNLTAGKNYIGVPGSYPYSNLVEMWKTICDENTKVENFDDKEINENKLHPIFNFIYELKRNFGATSFGNAKIKFLFHSFKDEKVGNAKSVVSSVVITKNNKEKNGILEIRLDFEKQNGDKPVSVSFYSPCSWEKEPVIVPSGEKPIEDKLKAVENDAKVKKEEHGKFYNLAAGAAKAVWSYTGAHIFGSKNENEKQ